MTIATAPIATAPQAQPGRPGADPEEPIPERIDPEAPDLTDPEEPVPFDPERRDPDFEPPPDMPPTSPASPEVPE